MENAKTTPEDVVSAVGAPIVDMADNGYNDGELSSLLEAYTKLLEVMSKPYYQIIKMEDTP